jgi:TPR repeat protein
VTARFVLLGAALALSLITGSPAQTQADPAQLVVRAEAFERGLGVPQDFDRAAELYRLAAEAGDPAGLNGLARAYAEGRGVETDPDQAVQFFARAAEAGQPVHVFDYAQALESGLAGDPDLGQAVLWYRRAAEAGHVPAVTSLGVMALEGRGMDRDPAMALALFERAAQAGDARAQSNLGLMYSRGDDVERDYERAVALFQAAAAQGLPQGLRNLSVMYANGFGVPVDEALSEQLLAQARLSDSLALDAALETVGLGFDRRLAQPDWSRPPDPALEAAAQGRDPVALYLTGYQLVLGAGVRADPATGEARLRAAADAGLASAGLALGLIYARGQGVPQDYEESYYWLSRSALARSPEAIALRDALLMEMSGAAVARAQTRLRQDYFQSE